MLPCKSIAGNRPRALQIAMNPINIDIDLDGRRPAEPRSPRAKLLTLAAFPSLQPASVEDAIARLLVAIGSGFAVVGLTRLLPPSPPVWALLALLGAIALAVVLLVVKFGHRSEQAALAVYGALGSVASLIAVFVG